MLPKQARPRRAGFRRQSPESFAYSVAHDLRTPLRGISGFAEALMEDHGDRLDETGRWYAARVRAGCARMSFLIDDLLDLSRVSRAEMNLEDVDLSAEATAISAELRGRDPGRQVRVTVQEGVRATADRALIRCMLENLLGNAWKSTPHRDGAAIEFATAPADGGSAKDGNGQVRPRPSPPFPPMTNAQIWSPGRTPVTRFRAKRRSMAFVSRSA